MSDVRSTARLGAATFVDALAAVWYPLVTRVLAESARRLGPLLRREWAELRRLAADPAAVWERVVDGWSSPPRRQATAAVAWTAVVPRRSALATHRHRQLPAVPPPPVEPPRRPELYLGFAAAVALLVAVAVGAAALG